MLARYGASPGVEPRSPVWEDWPIIAMLQGTVPPAGIEPASPGLQPGALPVELEAHGREPRRRTEFVLVPGQAGFRLPRSRWWRRPESNRLGSACRARPVPYLSSPGPPRPAMIL